MEGQMARWLERLQEYHFDIKYRKGCQHQNADVYCHITHLTSAKPLKNLNLLAMTVYLLFLQLTLTC